MDSLTPHTQRAVRWPTGGATEAGGGAVRGAAAAASAAAAKLATLLPAWPRTLVAGAERPAASLDAVMQQSEHLLELLSAPTEAPTSPKDNDDAPAAAPSSAPGRTWKEAAGRVHGRDGYAFGDLSRTVAGSVGGSGSRLSRLFTSSPPSERSDGPAADASSPGSASLPSASPPGCRLTTDAPARGHGVHDGRDVGMIRVCCAVVCEWVVKVPCSY